MEGLNRVCIMGALGADPEIRTTKGGLSVLSLRVATTERVKRGDEWTDHTEWHSVAVFGKRADGLAKVLTKGSRVYIEGPLRTTSWEKDGQKRYKTEISADKVLLAGGKSGGGARGDWSEKYAAKPASDPAQSDDIADDEIPF